MRRPVLACILLAWAGHSLAGWQVAGVCHSSLQAAAEHVCLVSGNAESSTLVYGATNNPQLLQTRRYCFGNMATESVQKFMQHRTCPVSGTCSSAWITAQMVDSSPTLCSDSDDATVIPDLVTLFYLFLGAAAAIWLLKNIVFRPLFRNT